MLSAISQLAAETKYTLITEDNYRTFGFSENPNPASDGDKEYVRFISDAPAQGARPIQADMSPNSLLLTVERAYRTEQEAGADGHATSRHNATEIYRGLEAHMPDALAAFSHSKSHGDIFAWAAQQADAQGPAATRAVPKPFEPRETPAVR